jgi:DNA-binding CsgD family transcriptional regulator
MLRVRGAGAFVLQSYCHGPVEIVLLLAAGYRVSSIAPALHITPQTARNHLKSIFRKARVHSQADLVALLRQQAL